MLSGETSPADIPTTEWTPPTLRPGRHLSERSDGRTCACSCFGWAQEVAWRGDDLSYTEGQPKLLNPLQENRLLPQRMRGSWILKGDIASLGGSSRRDVKTTQSVWVVNKYHKVSRWGQSWWCWDRRDFRHSVRDMSREDTYISCRW